MNKTQIFLSICLFIVFFSLLSVASATDTADNVTVTAVSDDSNAISVTNNENYDLGASSGSFTNLTTAISQAGGSLNLTGDYSYVLSDGDFSEGILIDKGITIDGQGCTINAGNNASIFNIQGNSKVILKNIVFTNAVGINGSAINLAPSAQLEIINCSFNHNVAQMCGGAIYVSDSSSLTSNLVIRDSTFDGNSARFGGAIYWTGDHGSLIDSVFTHNFASQDGGAIYWEGHNGLISGSTFEYNNVSGLKNSNKSETRQNNNTGIDEIRYDILGGDGGAILWKGSDAIIEDSTFNKNYAPYRGGAIFFTGMEGENCTNITIENTNFTENCAALNGGALNWASGSSNAVIIKSNFSKNIAKRSAGAIYISGNYLNITDSKFESNAATMEVTYDNRSSSGAFTSLGGNAGAICWMGSYGTVDNTKFIENAAAERGGAIQFERNENGTVKNCYFEKNSAQGDGGAIDWYHGAVNGQLLNSTFDGNRIIGYNGSGAGVHIEGYNATIRDCEFYNHYTNSDGAALYVAGDKGKVFDSVFENNTAGDDGGAIYWEGDDGYIYNITCTNNKGISITKEDGVNTSSSRGGTLSLIGENVTVEKSTFKSSEVSIDKNKDSSKVDGGAIFITGNNINVLECTFNDCKAVHNGGGMHIIGNNTRVLDCTIENTQSLLGGAIFIDGDDTIVDNSLFRHNKASDKAESGGTGGAIYVQGAGSTISNSDFAYGDAINYGGAIAVWGSDATITNNVFDNCSVKLYEGGAIYVNGVNATISLSNFTRNMAKGEFHGGAIQVSGDKTSILDCNFESCYAKTGGIIHISGANAFINNSDFKHGLKYNNKFPQDGGAIYVSGVNALISNSNFSDFNSNEYGGAIYIYGENTHIVDSNFDNCKAKYGGDIYVFGNYAKIEDSTFTLSNATSDGGAIYMTAWGASIKGSNITNCIAGANGGAIYVYNGGGISISECDFEDCLAKGTSASNGGGAIYIDGPDTHISTSNFNNNKVDPKAYGGTIYIKGVRTIIDTSVFNSSSAKQGGIIHIEGEQAIIRSSTFANSSSSSMGGAISVNGHNATIDGSVFDNVESSSNGGAIYVDGEDTDILHSSFNNCVSKGTHSGGAIYIDDKDTTVAYSNFTSCKADTAGAIAINGINSEISYCNLDNNTALGGGFRHGGGAIKVFGNYTIISNCNFTNGVASAGSGGALDIGGDHASVYYSWFDNNDACFNGGAINWDGGHGSDSIIGCTFTNNNCNYTQQGGGAVFWTAGEIGHIGSGGLIEDSIFINNTASQKHGGAVNWYHAKDSVINNCLFINNTAASDGGALYTGHQTGGGFNLTMTNCQFYNNTAHKHGGAIANQMEGSWIYNNTFDGNKAEASGGTILMKESYAINSVIDHCYIFNSYVNQSYSGNTYGQGGGAIRIDDDNITITNCAIYNSVANSTYGGAIYVYSVNASLINVTIQNAATLNDNGGAIYWEGKNGYLENVTIFNSSSNSMGKKDANGGAIYLKGSYCNFTNISISSSSSNNPNNGSSKSANGGAIYVAGESNRLSNITIDNSTASSANFRSDGGAIYWYGKSGNLTNASISNTLATGEGGAIFWSGTLATVDNIYIEYSRTNVTNSTKSANGGAIYSTGISELNNVNIINALASTDAGNIYGGAIYFKNGKFMNNVTVTGSRAITGNGTSYGGAVYWNREKANINKSSFVNNTADLGGAVYMDNINVNVYDTLFIGNVADLGGAFYGFGQTDLFNNVSFIENKAKSNAGAIYTKGAIFKLYNSSLTGNRAEKNGGAIYHNAPSSDSSEINGTNLTYNVAYKGSAIYTNKFVSLINAVLLDNQANANRFDNKKAGTNNITGENFTSAIFVGNDNVLNAIWVENNKVTQNCINVTYLGPNGIETFTGVPKKSDREVYQNITVEVYDDEGNFMESGTVITDANGAFNYTFKGKLDVTYNFAYIHESDDYYTYLRDTYSNRSIVKVNVNDFYQGNSTILYISLNDGAMGGLNGTVTVTFNDTNNTTLKINVTNGIYRENHTFPFDIGTYNVSAVFEGDLNHTADSNWNLTHVLPVDDVAIVKTVNITADFVNVTDIIKYTINVTNYGPTMATGVNVTEILTPYLKLLNSTASRGKYNYTEGKWYIGDLGVNEIVNLTIIAQVIHVGPITNTAWVNSNGWDTNTSNDISTAHNFTALPIVDMAITKEVNFTGLLNVTDKIKYTITVFNYGPCNATGVDVGEALDPRLQLISANPSIGRYENGTWHIGIMENGANATLTIEAQVVYSGIILNKVNVTCFETDTNMSNNNANVTNFAVANVDLQIAKKANVTGLVKIGDMIEFTISIYNAGPCNATGVYVGEQIRSPLRFVSGNVTIGNFDGSTWVIGNLNKGEVHNLTVIAEVVDIGQVINYVFITGSDNDTDLTNNHANLTNITVESSVDVSIVKKVNVSAVVNVSDSIKFTITVHNAGPADATGVVVNETLSPYLKLTSNQTSVGKWNGNVWTIGRLNSRATETLEIIAEVVNVGIISNVVAVTCNEPDSNMSNNHDEIDNITAVGVVDLQIAKKANVTGLVNVTDLIEFTIVVCNNGPCNASGVYVNETLDSHILAVSNRTTVGKWDGSRWNIGNLNKGENATLVIVAEVISAGDISNAVVVSSNDNDTNMSNNVANVTNITALDIVDVSIVKYLMNDTAYVGENIVYYIEVKNKGPSNATGVVVYENISEFVKVIGASDSNYDLTKHVWNIGNLAKGESKLLKLTVKVLDEGIVKNSVNVTSNENDTDMSNNNASASDILVIKKAEFDIIKTSNLTGEAYVGDLVNFTITFTNKGPSNATEIIVTDELPDGLAYVDSGSSTGGEGVHYIVGGKGYVDWNIGDLDVGEGASVWVVVKAMTNGTFVNVATVKPKEYSPNNSNKTNITVLPVVDLDINKTAVTIPARDTVYVGDEITFVVYVKNNGPCNATGVVVNENVTGLVEIISVFPSVGTSYNQSTGLWTIGNLGVGDIAGLMINVKVISNGTVENMVSVTSNEKDSNSSNNNASSQNITALPIVDVKVNKTVDVSEARIGDNITYTIKVKNNGPNDATNVNVSGKLSDNVAFVKYTASQGNYDATKNIWYIGKLTNASVATLTLTVKAIGEGTVENSVFVNSTEKDSNMANNNYTCENVTVTKLDTPIDLYTYNITYGEDEVLIVTLPVNATGTVNITVANRTYVDVPIKNGIVELPVTDLAGGNYAVDVVYGGDGKYLPNSTTGIFNVAPVTPIITIEVEDIWVWETEVLNVTVNAPGSVFVTVYGITVEIPLDNGVVTTDVLAAAKGDYKGNATWNIINLPAGTYPAFALYPGNENYTSVNTSDVFHVKDLIPTNVIVTADDIYVGEDAYINIVVGPEGVTGNVTVNVEGKNYTVPLSDGIGVLVVPGLSAGVKDVTVWYGGNKYYLPSQNATTFEVLKIKPPVDIDSPEITIGDDGTIIVTVPGDATGTITIEVDGEIYTAPIRDGEAIFFVPGLEVGLHDIIVHYSGDDKYLPSNTTGVIKVNPKKGPHDHNHTHDYNHTHEHKKSTIEHKMPATGNSIMALIAVIMSICFVQVRRFKK